jgi:hypothetical protein
MAENVSSTASPSLHTFGVLDVQTANFIDWLDTRQEAEASVRQIREFNPDMPADEIEIVEFDEKGMPV